MSPNKEIIKSYLDEIWFESNTDIIHQVFSSRAIVNSALFKTVGPGGKKDVSLNWVGALSGTGVDVLLLEEINDVVIAKWVCWGKHVNAFSNIKPSGEKIKFEGMSTYKFNNSKVVEYNGFVNLHKVFNVSPGEYVFDKKDVCSLELLKESLQEINGVLLSDKEIDCLSHWVSNVPDVDMAGLCQVKKSTIRTHKSNIIEKLNVGSKLELSDLLMDCNKIHLLSEYSRKIRKNNMFVKSIDNIT